VSFRNRLHWSGNVLDVHRHVSEVYVCHVLINDVRQMIIVWRNWRNWILSELTQGEHSLLLLQHHQSDRHDAPLVVAWC